MLDDITEILYALGEFLAGNRIELLLCVNIFALLWTVECLLRVSKNLRKKKEAAPAAVQEDLKLSLNIEKADVNIASMNEDIEKKPESADKVRICENKGAAPVMQSEEEYIGKKKDTEASHSGEKNLPTEPKKARPPVLFKSRSGRIYSREEILNRIRD